MKLWLHLSFIIASQSDSCMAKHLAIVICRDLKSAVQFFKPRFYFGNIFRWVNWSPNFILILAWSNCTSESCFLHCLDCSEPVTQTCSVSPEDCNFILKMNPTKAFFFEFCEIFKNIIFTEAIPKRFQQTFKSTYFI